MGADSSRTIEVEAGKSRLEGILGVPDGAQGIVIFAHGSGSGRLSPRNQFVAAELRQAGIATLLVDLLESWESDDRNKIFDIDLLAERLVAVTKWIMSNPDTKHLRVGYFGASTGAAAALQAAARPGADIGAIVSRGGRPDLAAECLPRVKAPTMLIVGGDDEPVIPLNEQAYALIQAPKSMVILPGAGHLFEEPGKLEGVAKLAAEWFKRHLSSKETGSIEMPVA